MTPGAITLLALENAQATLSGGVTAVRDCGGKDYLEFAVRDACNAGRQPGPAIAAAGRLSMTGGHGNRIGRVADGVEDVVRAVREQIHAGSDLHPRQDHGHRRPRRRGCSPERSRDQLLTPGVDPEDAHYSAEEMAAGIAEGHRFHRPCASHAQGRDGILNAVRGGIDSIEHGIFMDETCIEEMVERGTVVVPTLAAVVNILAGASRGIPDYVVEKAERVADVHRKSIAAFYKAGGRIAMGTDAGTPFNVHGENTSELAHMVEIGMTPRDTLVAATATAADLCQLGDRGRIRDGAVADFLLVDGNPVEDIAAAADRANHLAVIKNGTVHAGSLDRPRYATRAVPNAAE